MKKEFTVAILGATGLVGQRIIKQLEQSTIPVKKVKFLASKRSAGKKLKFNDQDVEVEETTPNSFSGVDIVLSSAGGAVSKKFLPEAVKRGSVCIDNTSAFRMNPEVPLIVPEVNGEEIKHHHGIIANPNCLTIQMVMALKPMMDSFGLKRVIVSTYQAASGAGHAALEELFKEAKDYMAGKDIRKEAKILPTSSDKKHYPLAFNLLPQIDVFEDDGYSHEEWKMIHETKKILLNDMNASDIKVTATCVRVPVEISHGESVYFELGNKNVTVADLEKVLKDFPGVQVQNDFRKQEYPQPLNAVGSNDTFVGRIRPDLETPGAFNMWVVADNLLKGAAGNTVQIAEKLVANNWF
ncbi:aspartate-semialdehyde dehydrogenase [Lactobacillus hominis]|uniref:Aspartate-semialdehyde dehydrogenase n=1 Tax=Lactobacillus hominis DSM 23910 = CRBIP 24.179 TaxID=1423758 RepID=I7IVA1_9LACO|nr:aspartate-semialdehyde dehydrogenase [Lactobacillus hominis]KRM85962.1 aspartate-semialdehyde dehydrogenase [Lactobacillus hominis DSM 23910 = CRBIP 24.179]MCT3348808.1 aspartate-semialdehyde dehydrogenase [Lactobacillus hominis]CCI81083.1 Aspartate-semialdehyde dehydrogenase [Lactobacillus hominis DSM 23910 = CRBIP 24.179]